MTAMFLVLEGIDGAGTTTQGHRLCERLRAHGEKPLFTCEPSAGPIGKRIRRFLKAGAAGRPLDPSALALMFAADRMHHVQSVVAPALARGRVVVCDRYVLSSLAYQGAFLDPAWVADINGRAPRPDLTLFVDVPVREAARRRARRGGHADQYEVDSVQRAVARRYRSFSNRVDLLGPVVRVSGSGSEEQVEGRLWRAITRAVSRRA